MDKLKPAHRLSKSEIDRIEADIRAWSGARITWDLVVARVDALLGRRFSRQALHAHTGIYSAYRETKKTLRMGRPPFKRASLADQLKAVRAQNEALKREIDALHERFVVWLFNAERYGLGERQLNAPLPRSPRERSDDMQRDRHRRERLREQRRRDQERRRQRMSQTATTRRA